MGDSRQQLVVVQRLAEPSNPVPTPKQDVGHVPEPLQGQQRAGTSSGTRVTPDAPLPSQRPQLCRIHVLPSCGTVPKAADAEGLVQSKKTGLISPPEETPLRLPDGCFGHDLPAGWSIHRPNGIRGMGHLHKHSPGAQGKESLKSTPAEITA